MADVLNPNKSESSEQPVMDKQLSNGEVLEIVKNNSGKEAYRRTLEAYGRDEVDVHQSTFDTSVKTLQKVQSKLAKNYRDRQPLYDFLQAKYRLPLSKSCGTENLPKKRRLECTDSETFASVKKDLADELHIAQQSNSDLKVKLNKAQAEIHRLRKSQTCRVNQRLKRKEMKISKQKTTIQGLRRELKSVKQKAMPKKPIRKKPRVLQCANCAYIDWSSKFRLEEVKDLKCTIQKLENENETLKQQLKHPEGNTIQVKKDGKTYTDNLRLAIYTCIDNNVAVDKLETVIRAVVWQLTDKELSGFPDSHTCRNMVREMHTLSRIQVASALENEQNTTLKYDGTTKAKQHWVETQIATEKGTLTIGVGKTAEGSAQAYRDYITKSIQSVGNAHAVRTGTDTTSSVLLSVTNTMTDRCATNAAVAEKLSEDQREIEGPDRESIRTFFCGVHPLDTFAKAADKVLAETDVQEVTHTYMHRNQSRTQSLLYALGKMIHKDGSGVPAEYRTYMAGRGIERTMIYHFVGERFHILFHNAGCAYHLWKDILYFIDHVWGPCNRLLQAVSADMKIGKLRLGCRALGIIGKVFTAPWLRFTMQERPVLELSSFYQEAESKLTSWTQDPSTIIRGHQWLGNLKPEDPVAASLFCFDETDAELEALLSKICASLLQILQRQCKDQLQGGKYDGPDERLLSTTKSCTANNISGERSMAKLKSSIDRAPSAKADYHESRILCSDNNTVTWVSEKDSTERAKDISIARQEAKNVSTAAKEDEREIQKCKKKLLIDKEKQILVRAEKQRLQKEHLLTDLFQVGGLWDTRDDVMEHLSTLKTKKSKLAALKTQIKVRKSLLDQKAGPELFAFSSKGKAYNVDQLTEHLCLLVERADGIEPHLNIFTECIVDPTILVGRSISHTWATEHGEKVYTGRVEEITESNGVFEYKISYEDDDQENPYVFMEFDEVLTDLKVGDLRLL